MSLRDQGKLKAFVCDHPGCGFQWRKSFHPAEIGAHARLLKDDGWLTIRDQGKFKHFCPAHVPEASKMRPGKRRRKVENEVKPPQPRWRADIDG